MLRPVQLLCMSLIHCTLQSIIVIRVPEGVIAKATALMQYLALTIRDILPYKLDNIILLSF